MSETPPTVVIAHGAYLQPANYIDFTASLHVLGLTEVRIPQLPSVSNSPPGEDAFAQDVAVLRKTIQSCLSSGRDVMVLAHSYGAVPLSDALAGLPHPTSKDRVKVLGVVFVAAAVPEEGESIAKAMKTGVAPYIQKKGDVCVATNPSAVFFNSLPADSPSVITGLEHILPHAVSAITAPVKTASWSQYPCAYIKCLKDNALSIEDQDHMIAKVKRHCAWKPAVAELPSDHMPFVSMPDKLAELVKTLVDDATEDA